MAKITKAALLKIQNKFRYFALLTLIVFSSQVFAYNDQIVIETPNIAKTIYDIRVHSFIRHLYEQRSLIDPLSKEWQKSYFEDERNNFVQQYLTQNYVNENDIKVKPTTAEIKKVVQRVNEVFKSQDEKTKALASLNITDNDVEQWITNRMIFERFVSNTIQNRVIMTDEKLDKHYQTWKKDRFNDKPYAEVQQKVREDLTKTLIKEEFEKWVDQEKRREKMILKVVAP